MSEKKEPESVLLANGVRVITDPNCGRAEYYVNADSFMERQDRLLALDLKLHQILYGRPIKVIL